MKSFFRMAFAAIVLLCAGCAGFSVPRIMGVHALRFESGVHEGTAEGYGGPLLVTVETDAAAILDIRIVHSAEDSFIGGEALRELIDMVLEADSTDVDAVSGATITSEAFFAAVDDALTKARIKR